MPRLNDLRDGRRLDLGGSDAYDLPDGVDDPGVEDSDRLLALLAADDRDRDLLADMDAAEEAQVLRPVERAGAGEDVAENRRDQRADPHRRRERLGLGSRRLVRRQHQRVQVARHMGEQDRSCTEQVRSMLAESPTLSSAQVVLRTVGLRTASLAVISTSALAGRVMPPFRGGRGNASENHVIRPDGQFCTAAFKGAGVTVR